MTKKTGAFAPVFLCCLIVGGLYYSTISLPFIPAW